MSLRSSIQERIREALKAHDQVLAGTLRFLFASIVNKEKEKRYRLSKESPKLSQEQLAKQSELQDQEVLDVVASEAKKHKESIEAFEKGGRKDLVVKEQAELKILEVYLPEQLSEEEVRRLVQEAIASTSASSAKDIGKVMVALMPKVKGRADGALVNKIVKELLTS
ncbi:MAG: hypothetical protein Greene071421_332 [Parcubacteria group bacterium Greene0714_21]|nr:MAG: hypothetical protein Greene041639_150 [Parcubacteria group bacterium Greene0416_39]TSC98039.1 MAG: hypothetical protein Greene101447_202 [Parcubacteria group bacterium Greene1014_47]TSD04170.1 MAG: hypothetical protein Greene071421_332 [Parcubacteria group bacterium Greene0714_21]